MGRVARGVLVGLLAMCGVGCGGEEVVDAAGSDPASIFGDRVDRLVIEVDYAEGAAPYAGTLGSFGEVWGVTVHNLQVLLPDDEVVVPTALSQMDAIGPVTGGGFDREAIMGLVAAHRQTRSEGSEASIYAIWLDGFYMADGVVDEDVLGIHFGGESVIAMFKPSIADLGDSPGPHVEKYVEQSTFVHELGHALGLVGRGLPLTSDHQDEDNGHHCTNPECVMYHLVEGSAGAKQFSKDLKSSGATLWGQECIDDAHAASAASAP